MSLYICAIYGCIGSILYPTTCIIMCVSYYEVCVNTIDECIENTEAEAIVSEVDGNEKSPRNDG